ncbi:hypothetical protein [Algivirga pacifica]|uniref:Uncharacterized protein n=1 Tax=Algivirga pacifica TaxID=1162670 RepID=A0ABP9D1G4_9BACT
MTSKHNDHQRYYEECLKKAQALQGDSLEFTIEYVNYSLKKLPSGLYQLSSQHRKQRGRSVWKLEAFFHDYGTALQHAFEVKPVIAPPPVEKVMQSSRRPIVPGSKKLQPIQRQIAYKRDIKITIQATQEEKEQLDHLVYLAREATRLPISRMDLIQHLIKHGHDWLQQLEKEHKLSQNK